MLVCFPNRSNSSVLSIEEVVDNTAIVEISPVDQGALSCNLYTCLVYAMGRDLHFSVAKILSYS